MIPFFTGYALLVWWLACRHRRTIPGLLIVVLGTLALIGISAFHSKLQVWSDNRIYVPPLQTMLKSFTILVAIVGLYIVVLPRRHPPGACPTCGYDLSALTSESGVCPECGAPLDSPPDPNDLVRADQVSKWGKAPPANSWSQDWFYDDPGSVADAAREERRARERDADSAEDDPPADAEHEHQER